MPTRAPWLLTLSLVLGACSRGEAPAASPAPAVAMPDAQRGGAASTPPSASPSPEERRLQGRYELWQDGEGGLGCELLLKAEPIPGGNALEADADCDENLDLGGDPHAWFVDGEQVLVIVDAARQPLLRMERLSDGDFQDRRDGDFVNAVVLSRP